MVEEEDALGNGMEELGLVGHGLLAVDAVSDGGVVLEAMDAILGMGLWAHVDLPPIGEFQGVHGGRERGWSVLEERQGLLVGSPDPTATVGRILRESLPELGRVSRDKVTVVAGRVSDGEGSHSQTDRLMERSDENPSEAGGFNKYPRMLRPNFSKYPTWRLHG